MARSNQSLRWHRALIALVLILGHGAATAIAAAPFCTLPHGGTMHAPGAALAHVEERAAGAETRAPERAESVPHDHAPDTPPAPGASVCAVSMLAGTAPTVILPPSSRGHAPVPMDQLPPASTDTPPPYHPPRA